MKNVFYLREFSGTPLAGNRRNVVRQLEDKALIELLIHAPEQGIEAAIRQYGGLAKAIIQRILGDGGDAEECLSDTFAALWRHTADFDPAHGSLKSYIAAIARNHAVSRYRKLKRRPVLIPPEEAELGQLTDSFHDDQERQENAALLREALLELEELDRELFIRRYYYGEPVISLAEKLGLTARAVESRLYRGRQRLKEILVQRGVVL